MTCFNDRETPYPFLEIVENKSDSHVKALTLKVYPLVIGAFLLVRNPLETSLHLTKWSTTETKDVMDNYSGKIMTEKVLLLKSLHIKMVLLRALLVAMEALAVGVSLPLASGRPSMRIGVLPPIQFLLLLESCPYLYGT
ncbi:hypothetical protein CQW23_24231 [Capsicum baccatum]|uniref:Uncharacterized protein n=1 Tax=Capsicum baccatum TaxID=33114 RepID=A0A2G2VU87_CAPBA|nr:hypothetical protein CQW23_24231 [Capsicum baccatum]